MLYEKTAQYQLAIEDYSKAIRLKPDDVIAATAYASRGGVYVEMGQHQRAIEDYNTAIRLEPDDADAYIDRGNAYILQGNNNLGCRDLQKACALGNCQLLELTKGKGHCR